MTVSEFLVRMPSKSAWHWILEVCPPDATVIVSAQDDTLTVIDKDGCGMTMPLAGKGPIVMFDLKP
jgi:hypothetical protein